LLYDLIDDAMIPFAA